MHLVINKKKFIVSFIIATIALIGDKNTEYANNPVVAAVCDNVTHGLIGTFTWIGIFITKTTSINFRFFLEFVICGIFSSLIDVDHFLAAKSFHLKDATSLKTRPFMHCTSLVLLIVLLVLSLSYLLKLNFLFKFGWILAAAFVSHHIRDSKRRGFWFWPFGSTPPIPTVFYILGQMLLPYFLSYLMNVIPPPNGINEFKINVEIV